MKTIPLGGDIGVVVRRAMRVRQRRAQVILGPGSKGKGDDRSDQLQMKNDDQWTDEELQQTETVLVRANET